MPESATCGQCLSEPPAFDASVAAFEYRFPLDRLVQRFKFGGDLAAGRWLGKELARATGGRERPELLVAPPLSRARLRGRGFNQAIELARVVAAAHGFRLDARAVERVRDTVAQAGLGRRERRANLREVFAVPRPCPGAHVAIVDDVMTTGATVEAVARALKRAGARRVSAWVVARTPEPGR